VPFLDDLVTELEDAGVGTWGTNIFTSTRAEVPVLASGEASLQLIETGGTAPENTQNALGQPAFMRPSAQILARANSKVQAEAKAWDAYRVMFRVRNKFINSGWYRDIKPLQAPIDLGLDDRGQIKYGFNVLAAYNRRD
jgi:hypothetical protein